NFYLGRIIREQIKGECDGSKFNDNFDSW
ncbi:MAG: hypothetical protein ACD_82C00193G0001, partial [uncultured bacterium]